MIITLKDIKELCKRGSGRSTEIENDLIEKVRTESNKTYIVICKNTDIRDLYIRHLRDQYDLWVVCDHRQHYLRSLSNVTIMFVNELRDANLTDMRLRGIRIEDVYFDTPESSLFNSLSLYEMIMAMKNN